MNQDSKVRALYLAIYSLGFFTGISVYVLSDEIGIDDHSRIRFHCVQASILGAIIFVIALLPYVWILALIAWLYGMYIGYSAGYGRDVQIPYVSDIAKILK